MVVNLASTSSCLAWQLRSCHLVSLSVGIVVLVICLSVFALLLLLLLLLGIGFGLLVLGVVAADREGHEDHQYEQQAC